MNLCYMPDSGLVEFDGTLEEFATLVQMYGEVSDSQLKRALDSMVYAFKATEDADEDDEGDPSAGDPR